MEKFIKDFTDTAQKVAAVASEKFAPVKEKLEASCKSVADSVSHMEKVVYCEECTCSSMDGWMCNGCGNMPAHATFPSRFCSEGVKEFPNG